MEIEALSSKASNSMYHKTWAKKYLSLSMRSIQYVPHNTHT